MSAPRTDVCVVGGGPAGLLLGLLLAKRGAKVVVLEGHETFDREFRGEVLQPSTARLLDKLVHQCGGQQVRQDDQPVLLELPLLFRHLLSSSR